MAKSGRRLRGGPIRYPLKVGVVFDSDPIGLSGRWLSGKGVCGRRWMRIKPHFPYVRKFILGLTAIGIENGEEAAPVIVRCFFPRFLFD